MPVVYRMKKYKGVTITPTVKGYRCSNDPSQRDFSSIQKAKDFINTKNQQWKLIEKQN